MAGRRWSQVRDVLTGRYCGFDFATNWKSRRGVEMSWWCVSAHECAPDYTVCDGFEVCLHQIRRLGNGGGFMSPIWPILSCRSKDDAVYWQGELMRFARTLDPAVREQYDKEINGDRRLADWLTSRGWKRYNHITWKQGAE